MGRFLAGSRLGACCTAPRNPTLPLPALGPLMAGQLRGGVYRQNGLGLESNWNFESQATATPPKTTAHCDQTNETNPPA